MKQFLWFGLIMVLLAGQPAVATVNSIVLGASASGTISGIALGNYDIGGSSNLYGFGSVSVDENLLFNEYEDFYPDPLQEPVQPVVGSLKIGLDMSVDNTLRIIANSQVLDTAAITTVRNDHSGLVSFSISKDASVVATFTGTASASLTIRDNFSALVWSSGDGTDPFDLTAGLYNIDYSLSSNFSPFIGFSLIEDFDLLLAFTPATEPPPPPGPNPPPGPEAVPEPVSVLVWGLGGIATILAKRRMQNPRDRVVLEIQ
jgi:hypothetical protein